MGERIDYFCENCGYEYSSFDQIFWIDESSDIFIEPLTMIASDLSFNAPVKGYFTKYFCYECKKFVDLFIIGEKVSGYDDGEIISLIEGIDDNAKIIHFDDSFQKCLTCAKELHPKAEYLFALDENDEFKISEDLIGFLRAENQKFSGKYYGYFCSECKKQINKFVITENSANLSDDELKAVIEEHTNDLTIFLRRDFELCPDCASTLNFLEDDSLCPNCMEGKLISSGIIMFD